MKKLIAILLTVLLAISCVVPAFAVYDVPIVNSGKRVVVLLSGDGDTLYDKDNNRLFKFTDILDKINNDDEEDGDDNSDLYASIFNVLKPFLIDGLKNNNWEPYYENLEKEIGELTLELQPDENGDIVNGSGISQDHKDFVADNMTRDKKDKNGNYGCYTYQFWYDWRKDPLETADELHTYLEAVRNVTKQQEIGLIGRCLGSNVVLAYIAKYGLDGLCGVGIDASVSNGAEFISESISGKFHVDAKAISRILTDSTVIGRMDLDPFILQTIEFAEKSGLIDGIVGMTKEKLYAKLAHGVTSALALSTFFKMPCYWACVKPDDFEDAKEYVFGPEGSEKRETYVGLIAKIDNYQATVRQNLPEILQSIPDSGKKVAIVSKYGFQMVPICQSSSAVADQYASVTSSSFGATTSTIFDTLSDEYIAARVAEGKGKYISPDRMVDASTCQFPDYTWFTKGIPHSQWSGEECAVLYTVITANRQYTVDDLVTTQFMAKVDGKVVPMTEENCHTENWEAKEETSNINPHVKRVFSFFTSFFTWLRYLIDFVKSKLGN